MATGEGWPLVTLMLVAPLVGVHKRWPKMLHAVTMDGLPVAKWPNGTATSPCGASGLRVLWSEQPVLWPPRVAGLAPMVRCPECHELTGKKRPRSTFKRAGQQGSQDA